MCFQCQVSQEQILLLLDNANGKCVSHILPLPLDLHWVNSLRGRERMSRRPTVTCIFSGDDNDLGQRDQSFYLRFVNRLNIGGGR